MVWCRRDPPLELPQREKHLACGDGYFSRGMCMALLSCLAKHWSDVWKEKLLQEEELGMCSNRGFHSTEIYLGMHRRHGDKEELLLQWSCTWGEGKAGSGRVYVCQWVLRESFCTNSGEGSCSLFSAFLHCATYPVSLRSQDWHHLFLFSYEFAIYKYSPLKSFPRLLASHSFTSWFAYP